MTKWTVHGTRRVYESEWMSVDLDDVEVPGGPRFEHHVLRVPYPGTATVVTEDDHVLLMWRHRFATDTWGWEVPAGRGEEGELPEVTAAREVEEETGYRIGKVEPLVAFHPSPGLTSMTTHVFHGTDAVKIGEPDPAESTKIEWVPLKEVRELVRKGRITDGDTLVALTCHLLWKA